MHNIQFVKYQGTGNDFVMIDGRGHDYQNEWTTEQIAHMCDRRFGIGGDGLIILVEEAGYDFRMIYFNADGSQSTMCGNGGRCIVAFANELSVIKDKTSFIAIDGPHEAIINSGLVQLKMQDVLSWSKDGDAYVLDTGSPHYVKFVDDVQAVDVPKEGSAIRYSDTYKQDGINVNFVEKTSDGISVATYERGVEDQTFSCGTGVVAASIAYTLGADLAGVDVAITTLGGELSVRVQRMGDKFLDIWLVGPAVRAFAGEIVI